MRIRWRFIFGAMIPVAVGVVALVLAAEPCLEWFSRRVADHLIERSRDSGFVIESLEFDRPSLDVPLGIVYRGVSGLSRIEDASVFRFERAVAFSIDRVMIRPLSLLPLRLAVDLEGISMVASPRVLGSNNKLASAELFEQGRARIIVAAGPGNPSAWVREALDGFLRQAIGGQLSPGNRLSGRVEFAVGARWHAARLYTLISSKGTRLALNRDDVARLGGEYDQPLTEAEIDLVALYPLRAPVLLRIKEHASTQSARLARGSNPVPQDAYRHVLWSYLLAVEFGETFAEQVTDAHEIGATYESGASRREMDLTNNAVGRRYARLGLGEAELASRILRDPEIIKQPVR